MDQAVGDRFRAPLVAGAAILLGLAPALGIAFAPALLVHAPLGLIGLNPSGSYLVMVATLVPISAFVVVAAVRRTLAAFLGFAAGRLYGDRTLQWIESRSPRLGSFTRVLERGFEKFGPLLLVIAPGMTFATLAGMARMRAWIAVALLLVGQAMWMTVTFYVGDALREWTAPLISWLSRYMLEATAAFTVVVVGWHAWRRRSKQRNLGFPFDSPGDPPDKATASLCCRS